MKHLVKLLIEEKDIRRTPSIYISIMLAHLEMKNWEEAQRIIEVMQELDMRPEESTVYLYLKDIVQCQSQEKLEDLWGYLSG